MSLITGALIILLSKIIAILFPTLLEVDWSFKGIFGKFDRGELRRGYQVYSEVCAGCLLKYVLLLERK